MYLYNTSLSICEPEDKIVLSQLVLANHGCKNGSYPFELTERVSVSACIANVPRGIFGTIE